MVRTFANGGRYRRLPVRQGRGQIAIPSPEGSRCLPRWVIEDLCARAEGPDWGAVAARLARYGLWEFEDYVELAVRA